jgi:hypothetical protein
LTKLSSIHSIKLRNAKRPRRHKKVHHLPMFRIFIALGLIVVLFLYFYWNSSQSERQNIPEQTGANTTPSPSPKNSIEIRFDERDYILAYESLNGKTISLIPNFTEKRSASAIAEENSCTVASSGGFYTKEDRPLGFFKANNEVVAQKVNNSTLLTGYFYVDGRGEAYIDSEAEGTHPIILQSGPLFTSDRPYPTRTDEYARRNMVIEDINGHEYIATIFSAENSYDGPQLMDMPDILFSISSPFRVQRALNLDGGSASFFKSSNGFEVSEIVAVGSVICLK